LAYAPDSVGLFQCRRSEFCNCITLSPFRFNFTVTHNELLSKIGQT